MIFEEYGTKLIFIQNKQGITNPFFRVGCESCLTQIERKRLYSGDFVEAGSGVYDCT